MTYKLVATVGRPYSSSFYALRGGRLVLKGYRRRYPVTIKLPEPWISTDPQRWEVHHRRCSRLVLSTDHSAIPHTRAGRALQPPTRATRAVVSRSNRLLGQTATRAALRIPKCQLVLHWGIHDSVLVVATLLKRCNRAAQSKGGAPSLDALPSTVVGASSPILIVLCWR